MKKNSTSKSAPACLNPWLTGLPRRSFRRRRLGEGGFFNLRASIASVFCLAGIFISLGGAGLYLSSSKAQALPGLGSGTTTGNSPNGPHVVRLLGPVAVNTNLRDLPYIPPTSHILKEMLDRDPRREVGASPIEASSFVRLPASITGTLRPVPTMPTPLLTFDGINRVQGGTTVPPDPDGDVGLNHYVQAVNNAFKVFDKNGNILSGPTSFDSFFAPLGNSTPCGLSEGKTDPFVLYDQMADRWLITTHAEDYSETAFSECIAVSRTGDPVTGGWNLYSLQDDENPRIKGDYPKYGLWPDAYYLTMDKWDGALVYALDRASLISGGPLNAIGFTILHSDSGRIFMVPASLRAGAPPPAGRQEFLLAINSLHAEGVMQTHVKGWLFHVDFTNPDNSTLGVGSDHSPNAQITVNGFINAGQGGYDEFVPQPETSRKLDTQGIKIMTPVVYQNRNGTESLWADHTVMLNYPAGPTAIRWYQFDVTGGKFPVTPVQQQDWSNGNDGLWRWMPSIAVDQNGNAAIGYSTSSENTFPSIRYAGRLASDALNNLAQGEAVMTDGHGSQTSYGRWGDYTMTTIDPADGISFWHTNEYYATTNSEDWSTRVGKFRLANPKSTLENISARAFVQTGDNVMIGGFMIEGTEPKRVIIRALGPELTQYGVPDALANPTLEVYDRTGALIASNNNWVSTIIGGIITSNQVHEIQASGYAPGNPFESAIIADLPAGNYTTVVRGVNNLTGVSLVEVYDLIPDTTSVLSNISTRGYVQTGDNVMIGGFMVQGSEPKKIIVRVIGPELTQYGVPDALANPSLELYDRTGALIASNNNWVTTIIGGIITSNQVHEIEASGYAPGNPFESAIIANLPAGNYTAVVRGVNNLTGVALLEVYNLH
jgi:hypothetical protein